MGLRDLFGRKSGVSTEDLQKVGGQKNKTTKEIVLPPRGKDGRFISDRSKVKASSTESASAKPGQNGKQNKR